MFKNGHMNVTDTEHSGRPITATTAQNEEKTRELILQNRRIKVDEIAKQLNISNGSAYSVVHDNLQFHKVRARWVPEQLMDEHKRTCLDICSCRLAHYREEGDSFLQRIVTGDGTWVHPYQPETKLKSTQWKHLSSPVTKKFKLQPLAGRLMLTIFWDSQGPILETTWNVEQLSQMQPDVTCFREV
jgi:hypothetical protein